MKHLLFLIVLTFSCITKAAEPVDTIAFTTTIEKVVTDITKNNKGKEITKYYFISNNQLIPTTKTVVEKYNLCKKHNVRCALDAIVSKKTKRIKKIILG